jgi:hypothetical protein
VAGAGRRGRWRWMAVAGGRGRPSCSSACWSSPLRRAPLMLALTYGLRSLSAPLRLSTCCLKVRHSLQTLASLHLQPAWCFLWEHKQALRKPCSTTHACVHSQPECWQDASDPSLGLAALGSQFSRAAVRVAGGCQGAHLEWRVTVCQPLIRRWAAAAAAAAAAALLKAHFCSHTIMSNG